MQGLLNVIVKILAFGDPQVSSNPRLKYVDWYRDQSGLAVSNPQSESHAIAPGQSKTLFDGTFASTVGADTAFTLSLSTLDPSRYRFTWVAGANPGLRTPRNLTLTGITVTFTVNSNSTITVTVPPGPDFTAVQVGDEIFIPHTTTGDAANVISVLNAGYWSVLGKASNTSLTLVRPVGQDFEGTSQAVALTSNTQLRAFSATGLQVGDSVNISAGFATGTRKTFEVVALTDTFFEVISTTPLAAESSIIPGVSGIVFFTTNKTFVYIEGNQECSVRVNGDTTDLQRLSPPDSSNTLSPAPYMRRGPCWKLVVVNLSTATLDVSVIHCE